MARAKLVSLEEETVPQDLDQLEKDVQLLLEQQEKDAALAEASSKFVSNCSAPEKDQEKKKDKKTKVPSSFLKNPAQHPEKPENKDESRFLQKPEKKKKQKNPATVRNTRFSTPLAAAALQQELGHIRRAKGEQYQSTVRLLKGLAQGDDAAEQYAARKRPELLKSPAKPKNT